MPSQLRVLANVAGDVEVEVDGRATLGALLDALEMRYPMLKGTLRDHLTRKRRPLVRFHACGKDLSLASQDTTLPEEISTGREPFIILGAIAGG